MTVSLTATLCLEVDFYREHILDRRLTPPYRCELCPFRSFPDRKDRLIDHLKYHKEPFFVAASSATFVQYSLALSIYRARAMSASLYGCPHGQCDYLAASARIIRDWNESVTDAERGLLQKSNQVPLVQVLTAAGPQSWIKSLTANINRLNEKVYYTNGFEKEAVAYSLLSHGQTAQVVEKLYSKWSAFPDSVPLLKVLHRGVMRKCLKRMFSDPQGMVQKKLSELEENATERG